MKIQSSDSKKDPGAQTSKESSGGFSLTPGYEGNPLGGTHSYLGENPPKLTPTKILQLQRTLGNQAVMRMIARQHQAKSHQATPTSNPKSVARSIDKHQCTSACYHIQRHAGHSDEESIVSRQAIQRQPAATNVIQRHSSWEHKALGDIEPKDLKVMAMGSNLKDGLGVATTGDDDTLLTITNATGQQVPVHRSDILHVFEQEINRIELWRDNPPKPTDTSDTYASRLKNLELVINPTSTWDVRLVSIPSTKTSVGGALNFKHSGPPYDPLIVTYGEMNTLADIYGNPDELKAANREDRYKVVQGIRQQTLFRFKDLKDKYSGTVKGAVKNKASLRVGEGFGKTKGSTGRFGETIGQVRLAGMGKKELTKDASGKKDQSSDYSAGLGRNACHFAPESWHSWAEYHTKARALALEAFQLETRNTTLQNNITQASQAMVGKAPGIVNATAMQIEADRQEIKANKAQISDKKNEAVLQNGFGDHFLQDSYAAGHLINKTEIMKWMVKWVDQKSASAGIKDFGFIADYTKDENWRRLQAIAYKQAGVGFEAARYDPAQVGTMPAKDPQSVENIGGPGDWKTRFNAMGLEIPNSVKPGSPFFNFLVWWQEYAVTKGTRELTVSKAVEKGGGAAGFVKLALAELIKDYVARVNGSGTKVATAQINPATMDRTTFLLRDDYVPKDAAKFRTMVWNMKNGTGLASQAAKDEHVEGSMKATMKNFHEFLNNNMLQLATNVLHNHFCENGLEVLSGTGVNLGRIYGDDAMLNKDSSVGVEYSATTAHMSRDAIYNIFTQGPTADAATPLNAISQRFPTQIKGNTGVVKPIDQWHAEDVEALSFTGVNGIPALLEQSHGSAKTRALGILKSNSLSPGMSKDLNVHAGALF